MCAVSMITGTFQQMYPQPNFFPPAIYPDFSEILKRLKAIDDKLGLADCQDAEKKKWMEAVDARMKALEEKTDAPY